MRKTLLLLSFLSLFSCASERHIVDTVALYDHDIEKIANTLYRRHFMETGLGINEIKNDISKKEMRLLKQHLKCQEIFLVYESPVANAADSIVIFTRGGTWEKEHTVVVDMRKKARESLPGGLKKLTKRIHFRTAQAIIPIS